MTEHGGADSRCDAGGLRTSGVVERFRAVLPLPAAAAAVSLGEGATPLLRLQRLPAAVGFDGELYVKFEGANPTGSFKDRGMAVAVTEAQARGAGAVICASTGNTSAAAAAYAARAGMRAFVLIPEGKVALGKLAQAVAYGAVVAQIRGNFDDGMRLVRELAERLPLTVVNSINPYRLQGQKTVAYEIVSALGRAPDYHALPVGNAGNITAHWIGYSELAGVGTAACLHCGGNCRFARQCVDGRPQMLGYQAAGSAPFMRGAPVAQPETVATAIRIGDPQSWQPAWIVQRESGGWFGELSDQEILAAQRQLAATEGVFCEPASAASVAGVLRDLRAGRIVRGATVVCTLTGHGLKDPDVILSAEPRIHVLDGSATALQRLIEQRL
ncbi:MAG: threonine synthase [Gammaproteobacteria bacterium]|nr:threonine synthase [Gammaproteobacteria bacterium]